MTIDDLLAFPSGIDLVERALAGKPKDREILKGLLEKAMLGSFDAVYSDTSDTEHVEVTASMHLLTLEIMADFFAVDGKSFYMEDPLRYVRTNLFMQLMLGIRKLTIGWPVYAFGAEGLGQSMIYPERQAPGSDPVDTLVDSHTWRHLAAPDFDAGIYRFIKEVLGHFAALSELPPVAHLPAPYSLAAEIYGQERLLADLKGDLEGVRALLDHLTERILAPWIADLAGALEGVWIELSDASGSPMFIGPHLTREIAAPPARRLISDFPWGGRVFLSNYRGDHLAATAGGPPSAGRGGRRRGRRAEGGSRQDEGRLENSLSEMIDFKHSICPFFVIRLAADEAPLATYVDKAMDSGMPLYLGIGASELDSNRASGPAASAEMCAKARDYAEAISRVSETLALAGRPRSALDWPGDIFIEDINAQTNLQLVKAVIEAMRERG